MNPPHRYKLFLSLFLVLATIGAYGQVYTFGYIHFDDGQYVAENLHLSDGLSLKGIRWALTTFYAANWHPLTWLSHMLDVSLFGWNPGAHHVINLIFHILNALLLFHLLHRMTGDLWPSGVVAALFAIHPLHVESVAWISERKDVLSTFFWVLTLLSYIRYLERPSRIRYAWMFACFMLGLTAKPMLVTLPFCLLLLDFWPLGRTRYARAPSATIHADHLPSPRILVTEKLPLFLLSGASMIVTYLAQNGSGAVGSLDYYPLGLRISNALVSYVVYLRKVVWPTDLIYLYLYPLHVPAWQTAGAIAVLSLITVFSIRRFHRCPYLLMGWLWYLGTLVPVIGLIQVGAQAMADRYTYMPLTGIFIAVAWGGADLIKRWALRQWIVRTSVAGIILAIFFSTVRQAGYWIDNHTLLSHALDVFPKHYVALTSLGHLYAQREDVDTAIQQYVAALNIAPYKDAHIGLAGQLVKKGKTAVALTHYQAILENNPDDFDAHYRMANALAAQGQLTDAAKHYEAVLRIDRRKICVYNDFGSVLARLGRLTEAMDQWEKSLKLEPGDPTAHFNLGNAYAAMNKPAEAYPHYLRALRAEPENPEIHNNLGNLLARQGRIQEAIRQYSECLHLRPDDTLARRNLRILMEIRDRSEADEAKG